MEKYMKYKCTVWGIFREIIPLLVAWRWRNKTLDQVTPSIVLVHFNSSVDCSLNFDRHTMVSITTKAIDFLCYRKTNPKTILVAKYIMIRVKVICERMLKNKLKALLPLHMEKERHWRVNCDINSQSGWGIMVFAIINVTTSKEKTNGRGGISNGIG